MRISIILFMAAMLSAQDAWTAPAAAPSSYDVEIVVFENKRPDLDGGEMWTTPNLQTLIADITASATAEDPIVDGGLTSSATVLAKDGTRRLLAHQRWTQTPEARSATQPVRIRSSDQTLDGVMHFYLSRFLHVDLNLVYSDSKLDLPGTVPAGATTVYRLSEHRRVKTQEFHYFDHPKLGAVVRITQTAKP